MHARKTTVSQRIAFVALLLPFAGSLTACGSDCPAVRLHYEGTARGAVIVNVEHRGGLVSAQSRFASVEQALAAFDGSADTAGDACWILPGPVESGEARLVAWIDVGGNNASPNGCLGSDPDGGAAGARSVCVPGDEDPVGTGPTLPWRSPAVIEIEIRDRVSSTEAGTGR